MELHQRNMAKEFILPLRIYYEDNKNYDIVFCKSLITVVCVDEHIKPRKIRDDLLEVLTNGN